MEKINIAELLKDCPKGMELDCTIFEGLEFDGIVDNECLPIRCRVKHPDGGYNIYNFTKYGCWLDMSFAKCVIFPKGKTTWEGFHRPFKDGDILTTITGSIFIYKKIDVYNYCGIYASLDIRNGFLPTYYSYLEDCCRFATEEEKQKLFDAIKANGYKWNAETKTLEKLPKFKVRDRVREKDDKAATFTISDIDDSCYYCGEYVICNICDQDNWELVPNKFDINTLVPFESKVLVRNDESQRWLPAFWGYKVVDGFITTFGWCKYCIPYKGNENLFKTNNDCDDFYKTWEK